MTLTIRDLYTTFFAVVTATIAYFTLNGFQLPWITNYRIGTLVLLLVGIFMCANSGMGPNTNWGTPMIMTASALGVIALLVGLAGLITGAKITFVILAGTMLLLWALATVRHMGGW